MATRDQLLDAMWETATDITAPPVATFAAVATDAAHLASTVLSVHAINVAEQARPKICWPADGHDEVQMLQYANKIRSLAEATSSDEQQRQLLLVINGARLAHKVIEAI